VSQGQQPPKGTLPLGSSGAPPRYVPAEPPGVPVSLPGRQPSHVQPAYGEPKGGYPTPVQGQAAFVAAAGREPPHGTPAQAGPGMPARPGDRSSELATGGAKTVFEFTGVHAEGADVRPRHGTFSGMDELPLAAEARARHVQTNLTRGGPTWILVGTGVAAIVAMTAYFGMRGNEAEPAPATIEAKMPPEASSTLPTTIEPPTQAPVVEPTRPPTAPKVPTTTPPKTKETKGTLPKKTSSTSNKTRESPSPKPAPAKPAAGVKVLEPKKPKRDDEGFGNLPKPPG